MLRADSQLRLAGARPGAGAAGWQDQQPAASIFNEGFLGIGGDQPNADLSVFKFGNQVLPGSYMVDVVRDGNALGQSSCASRKRRASATRNPA